MTIDWWTIGLQSINVLVLIWLLQKFFWRPVAGIIDQRRAAAAQMLSDAAAKRDEATAALGGIDATRAGFAAEREAILNDAREKAEVEKAARAADAAKEVKAIHAAAQAAIAKEREIAEKTLSSDASHLAIEIARRLVERVDGKTIRDMFLNRAVDAIRALSDAERRDVAVGKVPLDAITATSLDPEEEERARKLLDDAFGSPPTLNFKTDLSLIAGLELRGEHFTIANSWRADLARIETELSK